MVAAPGTGAILVESDPTGAAISINGEPTGLTTPATLTGITAHDVTVRLERRGFVSVEQALEVPTSGTITKAFTLSRSQPSRR